MRLKKKGDEKHTLNIHSAKDKDIELDCRQGLGENFFFFFSHIWKVRNMCLKWMQEATRGQENDRQRMVRAAMFVKN